MNEQDLVGRLPAMTLAQIALEIGKDWTNPYFGAVPYIAAMRQCQNVESRYGLEDGRDIVLRFLCNCATWRGPIAKAIKAELKARVKPRR